MKTVRLLLVVSALTLPWMGTVQSPQWLNTSNTALAAPPEGAPAQNPPAQGGPDINVKIDRDGGGDRVVWFANPLVLVAGAVGVVLVIALIAMASRGNGGTTIVREK
ncbi:MAG: hypothetical protein AB7V27_10120 [Candidatus Binatia bacterium]